MSRFTRKLPLALYGLTGGIGSGKSSAAAQFEACGIPVIDADKLGHQVIAPGGRAEAAVRDAFGDAILSDGVIDRKKLGQQVFSAPEKRVILNALVHPAIYAEVEAACYRLAQEGHQVALMEAALLGEDGAIDSAFSGLILILADDSIRKARLCEARGLSPEEVDQRIASQVPPESKIPMATWAIDNNTDRPSLNNAVTRIAQALFERHPRSS